MSLAECIRRESGTRDPAEVDQLCLDQAKCADGLGILEPYSGLVSLSIQDAGISSLDTLPKFNSLNTLKMSDNKIKGGLDNLLRLPQLEKLYLAGNQISSLEALADLAQLSKLGWLDLEGNPVTKLEGYSKSVFEMLPSLVVLDGKDRDGEELTEAEDDDEDDEDDDDDEGDDEDNEKADDDADADDNDDVCAGAEEDEDEDDEDVGASAGGGVTSGQGVEDDDDDDDEDDDEEEEGGEGFEEYVDYKAILSGDAQAYQEGESDNEEFKPEAEPEDFDIPDDEDDLGVLGKHPREGDDAA